GYEALAIMTPGWDGHERRRGPRVNVEARVDCGFEMRAKVRLVDISATGALLATDATLPVDSAGQLKAVLTSTRFSPTLKVQRTVSLPRNEGAQLGTVFLGMDDESRKSLEAFLKKATT
ncbi:MAG: PilZ domain-containing protein, partial [Vicinamibacterales bacterium]